MSKGGCQRVLMALTIFFIITTVLAVAALIWRELSRRPGEDNNIIQTNRSFLEQIRKQYPDRFRTLEEQMIYENHIKNASRLRPVSKNITTTSYCNADCGGQPLRRRRETSNALFHSCCVSSTSFSSPNETNNIHGVLRTLLHFAHMRQYFKVQSCSQAVGCTGCTCYVEDDLHTAVVVKIGVEQVNGVDDIEFDFFYFEGCCKCLNVGVSA